MTLNFRSHYSGDHWSEMIGGGYVKCSTTALKRAVNVFQRFPVGTRNKRTLVQFRSRIALRPLSNPDSLAHQVSLVMFCYEKWYAEKKGTFKIQTRRIALGFERESLQSRTFTLGVSLTQAI